jgi:ketosteroid isomerase-like protein
MSQENVDRAHAFYDAVNRRDLDAMVAQTGEEVELVSILVAMEGGYHGHGRASNAPIEQRLAQVIVWRDGKALHVDSFSSEAKAVQSLEAP